MRLAHARCTPVTAPVSTRVVAPARRCERGGDRVLSARYRVRELQVTYILDGKCNDSWVGGPEKFEADLVTAIETAWP